jgi:hypothetical protein
MTNLHSPKSRNALLDTIFWEILPAHQEKVEARWQKVADLYETVKYDPLTEFHDSATEPLKAELDLMKCDVQQYRNIIQGINIADIAGLYAITGMAGGKAWQTAKDDLSDIKESLQTIEDWAHEIRAGIHYCSEQK